MTSVVWLSYVDGVDARRQWDCGLLTRLFDRRLWLPPRHHQIEQVASFDDLTEDERGAIVVLPAQHHVDHVDRLNEDLAALDWCLLMLVGDECSLFPWEDVQHPNLKLWVMTPRPHLHATSGARFIGEGWNVDVPDILSEVPVDQAPDLDWMFAGQVNHERRKELVDSLRHLDGGVLLETPGFLQGWDQRTYLHNLARAKVIPCPSGPCTPDSFRFYETLEAGSVPLADARLSSLEWEGYWSFLFSEDVPFDVVHSWSKVAGRVREAVEEWPANANRLSAWWQRRKRIMAYWLEQDLRSLGADDMRPIQPSDLITVLVPTSPTPNNPDTSIIEQTIASIRAQPDLANAEIIVMIDGVREEQEDRRPAYEEYTRRLLRLTNRWRNVVPLLFEEHQHQANMAREALRMVATPYIVFVEHDTPVCGSIPWGGFTDALATGEVNMIRLAHESHVLDVHRYLHPLIDDGPVEVMGVPLLRTAQFSARPHIARTSWYARLIDTYFGTDSRTFIEDVLHGVLDFYWREEGLEGWKRFRTWLFAPPGGDFKRSLHTDGRAGDPKHPMVFAYPGGGTPDGAPRATSDRVD